jgi:hypothetical protein
MTIGKNAPSAKRDRNLAGYLQCDSPMDLESPGLHATEDTSPKDRRLFASQRRLTRHRQMKRPKKTQRTTAVTPPATPAAEDFPDFLADGSVAPDDSFGDADIRPEDGDWGGGVAGVGIPPRMAFVVIVVESTELLPRRVDVVTSVAGADAQKLAETVDGGEDGANDEVAGLGVSLVDWEFELAGKLVSEALSTLDGSVEDG